MTPENAVLLRAGGIKKYFSQSGAWGARRTVKAVDGVDLEIREGETVGLVGESGCGKSTLGRCLLRLQEPTGGSVQYRGQELCGLSHRAMRPYRREIQMIFQDPAASLNPRFSILQSVRLPLEVHKIGTPRQRQERAEELLDYVELNPSHWNKYPHELSGGQKQRVMIARALVLSPSFLVCDEPVSALDVSVQAQVLNLLKKIQREEHLATLFISHDLSVVRFLCDRIVVMYLGKVIESGRGADLFRKPLHPYTQALLSAIPIPEAGKKTERIALRGEMPSPLHPPEGCRFVTRCPYADALCGQAEPPLRQGPGGRCVACHHIERIHGEEVFPAHA